MTSSPLPFILLLANRLGTCCTLALLAASAASPAFALPATATYSTNCAPGAATVTGNLDASTPVVTSSFTGVGVGFGCATEIGLGDAAGVPHIGPNVLLTTTSAGTATFFNASLTYTYVATPSIDLPVDPMTLLVPLELIGIARGRVVGASSGGSGSGMYGSDFGGPSAGLRASMDASGSCIFGQLGSVGGLPTCVDLNKLTAQVTPGASGTITLFGQAVYTLNAAGSAAAFAFADPMLQIDPLAEFAPGMRYADFFTLEFSSGVVNAVPEPGTALSLGAALAAFAFKRRAQRAVRANRG